MADEFDSILDTPNDLPGDDLPGDGDDPVETPPTEAPESDEGTPDLDASPF